MGTTQSRQRDACTQTSPFECRKAIIELPLRSCSTLYNKVVCTVPPATVKNSLDARITQPLHKRRKYDPNCSPLKSKFGDKCISSQPIILHRKANNTSLQITADAVVGQYTFKGFPPQKTLRRRMSSKKIVKRQDSSKGFEMNVENNSTLSIFKFKLNKKVEFVRSVAPTSLCNKETSTEFESQRNKEVEFADSVVLEPSVCINSTLAESESQQNKKVTSLDLVESLESIIKNSNFTEFENLEKENTTIAGPIAPEPAARSKWTLTLSERKQNKIVNSIARGPSICINSTLTGSESKRNKEETFVNSLAPVQSILKISNLMKYESQEKESMTITDSTAPEPSASSKSTQTESDRKQRIKEVTYVDSIAPSASIRKNSNLTEYESQVKNEFQNGSICIKHIPLHRREDNATLQIMADAVVGLHTLKGFPTNKVLRRKKRRKKTTNYRDSSDVEMNIESNKKVTFVDSVEAAPSVRRNSNLTKYESPMKKTVTTSDPITRVPSILRNPSLKNSKSERNKKLTYVYSVAPASSIRKHFNLTEYESQQMKKVSFVDSLALSSSIRRNSHLTMYENHMKTEFEDKNICTEHIALPGKKENAALQIIADAVDEQRTVKALPSNKVFRKRMRCKKTVTCQDSSDDFEINIKRNKKVPFADSVPSSVRILRNSNLKKYESSLNKNMTIVYPLAPLPSIRRNSTLKKSKSERNKYMTFEDLIAPSPSILRNSTSTKPENQRNKNVAFVDSVGPVLLIRSHSTLSKSVNNRNQKQKVLFENSTAQANSIRKNWTLPKYEIQHKKRVTFADPIASWIAIRRNSILPKYEIQRKKKVTFANSLKAVPSIRNSRAKMVAFADSIAPVKFILTNSPLPKHESQRNERVIRADHLVTEPFSVKDDTTENCFHDAPKYYDLHISNEKLFTDTEEDDGKKLNPCEKRSSELNYNSDSSNHSIPMVKLSYEMRKIYYYL